VSDALREAELWREMTAGADEAKDRMAAAAEPRPETTGTRSGSEVTAIRFPSRLATRVPGRTAPRSNREPKAS